MCSKISAIAADLEDSNRKARGKVGLFAKYWKFFQNKTDVAVRFYQFCHFGVGFAAVATAIIHELDNGNISVRVATDPVRRTAEQCGCIVLNQHKIILQFRFCFAAF